MNAPANLAPARGARTPDAEPADTAATEAGDSLKIKNIEKGVKI